ncbi:MAG TPA: TraR/DksA C4-type zinc finger protein, partial [Clostridia bacterium]|nr:TraR/DksA C4-type zinc finger protein [Clostridia bacterium]
MEILKSTTKVARVRGRTSTQEILGGSTPNLRVHRKWAEQRRQLTALREEFSGTRDRQTYSAKEVVALSGEHMADAATDSYDRDCALALLSSAQNALYEIEQALNRIDNGTYGVCELTGESIEAERLKAIPWTRYSAVAQA